MHKKDRHISCQVYWIKSVVFHVLLQSLLKSSQDLYVCSITIEKLTKLIFDKSSETKVWLLKSNSLLDRNAMQEHDEVNGKKTLWGREIIGILFQLIWS